MRRVPGATVSHGTLGALGMLAGLFAWLGVAQSPSGLPGVLARTWAATESAGTARFVERMAFGTLTPRVTSLATSSSVGSVDFASDEVALRTRVRQIGLPPQRFTSFLAPGSLYQRSVRGPRRPWIEQPSSAEPLLSIPALAALRSELSGTPRRAGNGSVRGVPTTEFTLEVTALCTLGGGARDRLESRITLWVDREQRILRVVLIQRDVIGFDTAAPRRSFTDSVVTLGGFGRPMLFGRPTRVLHIADRRGPGPPARSMGPGCETSGPALP